MKHIISHSLKASAVLAALFLSNCAEPAISDLDKAPKEGAEFTIALAKEYSDLAKKESRIYNDVIDARHFALKGQQAAEGKIVEPEDLKDWDIHPNDKPMIEDGRHRLLFVLARGGFYIEPELMAKVQVAFDCMIEEYEEGSNLHKDQSREMGICHKLFWDRLKQAEEALFRNGPVRSVSFDYNSANIEHDGMLVVKDVVARIKKFQDRRIMLVGHTDPVGKAGHNKNLSYARAEAVKKALIAQGLQPHMIKIVVGRGEIKNSRRELEPASRDVDIYFM
jgi:flagellar motor protein MotB